MIAAAFRHIVTALLGKTSCTMPCCGRPTRAYGYCIRHIHSYRFEQEMAHARR